MNMRTNKLFNRRKTRREFLGDCGKMTGIGAMSSMINLSMTNKVMAQRTPADFAGDYKAIVCIFLGGGNDSFNMLTPSDTKASTVIEGNTEYDDYLESRGRISIAADSMIDITTNSGEDYHVHYSMPEVVDMFNAGDLSFLANVGTMVEPITKAQYQNGSRERPIALASHFDQSKQWQNSVPNMRAGSLAGTGWIGRMSEILNDTANNGATLNANLSPGGNNLVQTSASSRPLPLVGGAKGFDQYNAKLDLKQVIDDDLELQYASILQNHYNHIRQTSVGNNNALELVERETEINTVFPGYDEETGQYSNPISSQLIQIVKYIKSQAQFGHQRQTFYVSFGGWDAHTRTLASSQTKLAQLSQGMAAFNEALKEIGYHDKVITYTASDFGRNLYTNGTGSNHGWGGNHMLMGGPINGGEVLGQYPSLSLYGDNMVNAGTAVPTTSVDELHASIASWFGVNNDSEMEAILPNIRNFWAAGQAGTPISNFLA